MIRKMFVEIKCQCGFNLAKGRDIYGDKTLTCFECGQQFKTHEIVPSIIKAKLERTEIMPPNYGNQLLEELWT
jgi:hypothetical protein